MISHDSGVYEILNTVSNKRYIGSAVDFSKRWNQHRYALKRGIHHSPRLQHAWNKHGREAFKFLPILTCQPSMLLFYEQQLLDKAKPEYNIAQNAQAPMMGRKHSESTKKKMSESLVGNTRALGRVMSEEHKYKVGAGNRGKTFPPEFGARISAAKKGVPISKRGPMSEERKLKLSQIKLAAGRKMPEEQKAALAGRMRGNTYAKGIRYTEEQKAVMAAKRKATRAINLSRRGSDAD